MTQAVKGSCIPALALSIAVIKCDPDNALILSSAYLRLPDAHI